MIPGYELLARIGTGARSTIHKVAETSTGNVFAVKHVVRGPDEDDRFLRQAETEFNVAKRLEHPNLRACHAIHRVRKWGRTKQLYVFMDYLEGMTFEQARPNRLDWFLQIMRKVALGLDALHERGYVHSDIKPNNIILGKNGMVKIIDYGQSCAIGHRKQRIQGTPDYIAPEQVTRQRLDKRTDVFNLGATMYWALTDTAYPTDIRNPGRATNKDIAKGSQALTPREINPKIPGALSQLVMDCCRESPSDRPVDMRQVAARLEVVQRLWQKQHGQATKQPAIRQPANQQPTNMQPTQQGERPTKPSNVDSNDLAKKEQRAGGE